MLTHAEIKKICRKFGIQAQTIQEIHSGVYKIIATNKKIYCLKRMPYDPLHLRWIDRTIHTLRKKGPILFGWRSSTNNTPLFVKAADATPYVLIPWIEGRWIDPTSHRQMHDSGALLANFHLSGSSLVTPKVSKRGILSLLYRSFQVDQKMLKDMVKKAQRKEFHSPLDRMLQRHGSELLQQADQSLDSLSRDFHHYRNATTTLCHGDAGPTNIIKTKKEMYLIDFETLRFNLRAYDIYRMIYNSCHTHNWDFAIAKSILDGYQKITKLNQTDYDFIKVLLRFPRGICKLINHYDKRDSKIKRLIEREFPIILAHEQKRSSFLRKLDEYARDYHKK